MNARTRLASKLLAVWLVVLVASPFTASFRPWNPSAPIGEAPIKQSLTGDDLLKPVVVPAVPSPIVLLSNRALPEVFLASSGTRQHDVLHTVLRL